MIQRKNMNTFNNKNYEKEKLEIGDWREGGRVQRENSRNLYLEKGNVCLFIWYI